MYHCQSEHRIICTINFDVKGLNLTSLFMLKKPLGPLQSICSNGTKIFVVLIIIIRNNELNYSITNSTKDKQQDGQRGIRVNMII